MINFFKFTGFLVITKLFGIWKYVNTTNHQGNANQNHSEISLHTCTDSYYRKESHIYMESKGKKKKKVMKNLMVRWE